MSRHRTGCATLLVVCCTAFAAGLSAEPPEAGSAQFGLTLSSKPTKEKFAVGEPVFISLVLRNEKDQAQPLWLRGRLRDCLLRLEIMDPAKESCFRSVELKQTSDSIIVLRPTELEGGAEIRDHLTVWFRAFGDIPDERSLVFRANGRYKYRIRLGGSVGSEAEGTKRGFSLRTEGTVYVGGRQEGFAELVRGLRQILEDKSSVPFGRRDALETLIEQLGDSPYAKYVKWLRVKSFLEAGCPLIEEGGEEGQKEIERQQQLSAELLDESDEGDTPLARDALTVKGILCILRGQTKEAREILRDLENRFGPTRGMRRLRQWAY